MDTKQNVNETSAKIAALNDAYRKGGKFMITEGISSLPNVIGVFKAVEAFDVFTNDNDPYSEHDFGSFEWYGKRVYWKIDYYNRSLTGWCDPLSNECQRVLTVLLAEEY